ncbi:MAG: glycine betaine ABC transporter substrate-binding protein [Dehalococcoidales bacterium]|nr:glycine betaine ABC transporter substrate-binding protein [Dehalococcoidales bacterium]
MQFKNIKRWLPVLLSILLLAALFTGCGESEEEKPTILVIDTQYESLWINNAIFKFVVENGYGYPVETVETTTVVYQVALPKGELHLTMELWQQNQAEWYNEQISLGTIENLNMTYEGGPQFFVIPQWVHDEYGITTIEDLKDNWELFEDPEDPNKGVFINSITGWTCTLINDVKIKAYGIDEYFNIMEPGTMGGLDAALLGPMIKHEPVVGYYWAPTALMGMYDWFVLEEPEYDADVWAKIMSTIEDMETIDEVTEACAYETLPIEKGAWSGLRDIAPDVVEMMEKMNVGLQPLNVTAAWYNENEMQDYETAAVYYLENYEDRWETWLTDDAYDKVKEALDNYEK